MQLGDALRAVMEGRCGLWRGRHPRWPAEDQTFGPLSSKASAATDHGRGLAGRARRVRARGAEAA